MRYLLLLTLFVGCSVPPKPVACDDCRKLQEQVRVLDAEVFKLVGDVETLTRDLHSTARSITKIEVDFEDKVNSVLQKRNLEESR